MDRSTPACHPSHLPQPITTIDHNPISRYYQSSNNTSPIPLQCWQGAWGGGAPVFAALSSTHQLFWSAPDTLVERKFWQGTHAVNVKLQVLYLINAENNDMTAVEGAQ